jgi:hypothetical protein
MASIVAACIGLAMLGTAVGGALAWATRPPPFLPPAKPGELHVRQMPTVRQQYDLAKMASLEKEQHWQAVERYFPADESSENLYYSRLASRGLANFYVSSQRYAEALKLYSKLAALDDPETDLQLSGLAGEAVVFHRFMQTEKDQHIVDWLDQQVIERLIRLRDEPNLDQRISGFLAAEIRQLLEEYAQRGER